MGVHLQVVAAVAPFMMADLGLGYGEVGTLIGAFLLPGMALAIPGGLVSRRIGDVRTLLAAIVLLGAGTLLLGASADFWSALAGRLVSGAGGTLLVMQVAKIATDWFAGRELATAIALLLTTLPLGIAAVMAGVPTLAAASGWRAAAWIAVGTTVALFVVTAAVLRGTPATAAPATGRRWDLTRREAALMLVSGFTFSLVNGGLVTFASFTPTWLQAGGRDAVQAAALASWTSWVMIVALPLSGPLLDRTGRVTTWMVASTLAVAGVCVGLPSGGPSLLWIVLFGLLLSPLAVGSMALPGQVLRPESRAVGLGLFFTMNYTAFGLLPAAAGALLDATQSAAAPHWFNAGVFVAVAPLTLLFHRLHHRQPVG